MKIGASTWPFKWDPPYDDALRRIASLGFKAAELIAWDRGTDFLKEYYTPGTIRELKAILKGEGLFLSQFLSTSYALASPDAEKRKQGVERYRRVTEVAKELGAPVIDTIACWPFGFVSGEVFPRITTKPLVQTYTANVPGNLDWNKNYDDYVDSLQKCSAIAKDASMFCVVEPHPAAFVATAAGALRLIEHVNSPAFGINFDPSHSFPCGDFPNVSIYQLGHHIKHLHLSDNDGVTNVHWRPGRGKMDWKAMFQALKDIGYDGTVSIELEDVPGVSRGHAESPGVYRNETATEALIAENAAALHYIKGICKEVGISVDQ